MSFFRLPRAGPEFSISIRTDFRIALGAFVFLLLLMTLCRSLTDDGVHFQPWTSDRLMQTVALEDLRHDPVTSLEWNHIQPPMLDLIRAAIVSLVPNRSEFEALQFVDFWLLILWAGLYAALGGLAFRWGCELAGRRVGFWCAGIVLLHPATIFYATMVDSTLLTALLTLAMLRALWLARDGRMVSIVKLSAIYLALFYTRSMFQWPFPLVLAFSLSMMRVPRRVVLAFLVITIFGSGIHVAKQLGRFDTVFTSSLSGFNLTRSVGMDDTEIYLHMLDDRADEPLAAGRDPAVLTRPMIRDGIPNFNHRAYLDESHRLLRVYRDYLLLTPPSEILRGYLFNLWLYVQPSSRYTRHAIVDQLPWRRISDRLLAFPLVLIPTLLAMVAWLQAAGRRSGLRTALGMAAPVVSIVLLSVLCERGENMRYKFFLEPAWIVFLVVWGWGFVRGILPSRASPSNATDGREVLPPHSVDRF